MTSGYDLKVDLPNLPKGAEVQVAGLGTFENGKTYEVSKAEAEGFRIYHSRQETVENDDGSLVTVKEKGPTLLQSQFYGIEVSVKGSGSNSNQTNTGNGGDQS